MTSADPQDSTLDEVCYRHPDRKAGVSCQRCDRLICSQCMHQASVGVHCPECTKGAAQKVYTARTLPGVNGTVTKVIVGLNVLVFLAANALTFSRVNGNLRLWAPPIDVDSEWWRIVTGGFAHANVLHIGMNMFALWGLGQMLERRLGPTLFGAAYAASLLGGSFAALLFDPNQPVVGASGAIYGLMGLVVMALRDRGIGLGESGMGRVLLINGAISFLPFVSLWGHLGGFVAGLIVGALVMGINPGDPPIVKDSKSQIGAVVGMAVLLFGASIWAASLWMNPIL